MSDKPKRRTKEQLAEFEMKIIQLRRNGVPFEKIAMSTGDSLSNVTRAYKRVLRRVPVRDIQGLRSIQDMQLEEIFQRAMALAQKGDVQALGEARKALNDRAKLFGLEAAVTIKNEFTGKDGGPIQTQSITDEEIEDMTDAERRTIREIAQRQVNGRA